MVDRLILMRYRTMLAAGAALVATCICIVQRHVHVVLSRPETYTNPLHHRCGLLMLASCGWAAVEMLIAGRSA